MAQNDRVNQRDETESRANGDASSALIDQALLIQREERQLSTQDKVAMGNWLQDNFRRIEKAQYKNAEKTDGHTLYSPDGSISPPDLRQIYNDGQWKDGTPLTFRDKLFAKQAISHFDQLGQGGTFGQKIDKYDVERLQNGAAARDLGDGKTESRFKDGTRMRSVEGNVQITRPDGTKVYADRDARMVLHPNGKGELVIEQLGGLDPNLNATVPLQRLKDGSWQAKDEEGNTINLSFDKDRARAKVNGEVVFDRDENGFSLVGENGEVVTATTKEVTFSGNPDERMTYARNEDETVRALRTSNGDKEVHYEDTAAIIHHADGSKTVFWTESSEKGQLVEIDKNNKLTLKDDDGKPLTTIVSEDGTQTAQAPNFKATLKPNGEITVDYKSVEETKNLTTGETKTKLIPVTFTITPNGRYTGSTDGAEPTTLDPVQPPPLR